MKNEFKVFENELDVILQEAEACVTTRHEINTAIIKLKSSILTEMKFPTDKVIFFTFDTYPCKI